MKENNSPETEENGQKPQNKTYFYIALGTCAAGAVFFGLTFTVLGIYALIAAVLLEIAALSFLNTQKKKYDFKAVFIVKVITYALLSAFLTFFLGGLIYAAVQ